MGETGEGVLSGEDEFPPLAGIDALKRASEAGGVSEAHLDEDERLPLLHDEIDLTKAAAVVAGEPPKTSHFKGAEGKGFSQITF